MANGVLQSMKNGCLMVIVPDALSAIVRKGEITPRYYNPGGLFGKVHIVMTQSDEVEPSDLQKAVGSAELHVHSIPLKSKLFLRTLGYRPSLLRGWAEKGVELARKIKPSLIRCQDNSFNAFMGAQIKQELGIPLIISLHGNPDADLRGAVATTISEKVRALAHKAVEGPGLRLADHVIAVYEPILPYLKSNRVKQYSLIYNAVGYDVKPKNDYALHAPAVLLCVGRQQSLFKDPRNILESLPEFDNARLIMIGTGDLHEKLIELTHNLKCSARCQLISALSNEKVLNMMHDADIYVFNQITLGISKTIIEAALTGLPIIVNRRPRGGRDELDADWLLQVEDTKSGYMAGIEELIHNQGEREKLGRLARAYAREHYAPEAMEEKVVEIYRSLMRK